MMYMQVRTIGIECAECNGINLDLILLSSVFGKEIMLNHFKWKSRSNE